MKTSKLLLLATLFSLAVPAFAQVNDTYVIPAAANARGAFGTHWMTRFSIFNPQLDYPLVVSVTYLPTGGAQGIEELIELPPNSLAYSDNILQDLFDVNSGSGALLVAAFAEDNPGVADEVLARSFLVTTDTFNNHPSGTYGQTIEGTWTGLLDYDVDLISSVAHGIRHGGKWRTNVGAVNLGRCVANLLINVYDADGRKILNQAPYALPPLGHMQDRLPVAVENGTIEFFVSDPCANDDDRYAIVFPYTSTIDQQSGDPTYQSPKLLATANVLYAKGRKVDPHALGKKIDSAYARNVREQAERRGRASLKKTATGWEIAQ
ncbi:MAG TPA: hypothetical protein VE010_16665 [Thermoanaerobaculia bacterium]|nr:hypothetical protein [Thermoanaerobaculia bacterium]